MTSIEGTGPTNTAAKLKLQKLAKSERSSMKAELVRHEDGRYGPAPQREVRTGDTVRAFHPRMFGVVLQGRIEKVGRKWITVDFGPLRGGTCKVSRRDIVQD